MAKLKIQQKFGITPNHLLNNPNISWKAKGLYGYLQSKPDDRDFAVTRISKDTSDGEKSTISGIKELESAGYLERVKFQNDKGYWDIEYILYDNPYTDNRQKEIIPTTGNPPADNPSADNRQTNKKRSTKQEEEKKNNIILPNGNIEQSSENSDLGNLKNGSNGSQEKTFNDSDASKISSAPAVVVAPVKSTTIKEDKRDTDIDIVIETIKALNGGITDDARDKIRISGNNLKSKISKIKGFSGDYGLFILSLHENCSDFYKKKFNSVESVYWNLVEIISDVRVNISNKNLSNNKKSSGVTSV